MKTQFRVWVFYDQKNKKESDPLSLVQAQIFILGIKVKDFEQYMLWTPGWKTWAHLEEFLNSEQTFFTKLKAPNPKKSKKEMKYEVDLPEGGENLLESEGESEEDSSLSNHFDKTITEKTIIDKTRHGKTLSGAAESSKNPNGRGSSGATITGKTRHGKKPAAVTQTKLEEDSLPSSPSAYWHPDFSIMDVERNASEKSLLDLKFERERRSEVRYDLMIEILIISNKGKTFRCHTQNISKSGILLTDPLPKDFVRGFFDMIMINKFEEDPKKSRLLIRCKTVGDLSDLKRLSFVSPSDETIHRLIQFIEIYQQNTQNLKIS